MADNKPAKFGGTKSKFGTKQQTGPEDKKRKQRVAVLIKKREEEKRKGKA